MSEDLNKEILIELKKLDEKLDQLEEAKGLSAPMKFFALLLGFVVLGPLFSYLVFALLS